MIQIVRLRIELEQVKPRVWRRIEVPATIMLDDLHLAIQSAMGWANYHLYEFKAGKASYGIPDPDAALDTKFLPAAKSSLAELLAGNRTAIEYIYDFGDDWRHSVIVEARTDSDPATTYPRLLGGEGCCPPEDVGGPFGYADFLEAIANPKHRRHAELIEWCGGGFDPSHFDARAVGSKVDRLAKRLARRKQKSAAGTIH